MFYVSAFVTLDREIRKAIVVYSLVPIAVPVHATLGTVIAPTNHTEFTIEVYLTHSLEKVICLYRPYKLCVVSINLVVCMTVLGLQIVYSLLAAQSGKQNTNLSRGHLMIL